MHRIEDPRGTEKHTVKDIAQELHDMLPRGQAWNPEARQEGRDLVVYYAISHDCWNFFGLRFADGRWQLVLTGGGCD